MNRIATVAALFLASSDALLVGVAPKCAPIRIFMESEMEYRKRMADTRDASKVFAAANRASAAQAMGGEERRAW